MRFACVHGASRSIVNTVRTPRRSCLFVRKYGSSSPRWSPPSSEAFGEDDGLDYEQTFQIRGKPNDRAQNIAVLGGGITGLATAFHLSELIPDANITIFESQNRIGGWIDSERITVDGGDVLFEWGARNLRPDLRGSGHATANLITRIGKADHVVAVPNNSPAAANRYIYYPDHLVRMPGPVGRPGISGALIGMYRAISSLLGEPVFAGVFSSLLAEPRVQVRPRSLQDESVGDFIKRRFGSVIADNLLSAMFHGIYAGDIYNLSARTLLPKLWYMETRDPEGNGVLPEFGELLFNGQTLLSHQMAHYIWLKQKTKGLPGNHDVSPEKMLNASVYTFGNGLAELVHGIANALEDSPANVEVKTGIKVDSLSFDSASNQVVVGTSGTSPDQSELKSFDYVVSTLDPQALRASISSTAEGADNSGTSDAVQNGFAAACALTSEAANVMVVNLYYDNPQLIPTSLAGFGYLLPRTVPLELNPERALGVIFGSESSGPRGSKSVEPREMGPRLIDGLSKERVLCRTGQDMAEGTKLTIMFGGHWWKNWKDSDIPSEAESIEMSKRLLARHLGITEEPAVAKARFAKHAIPQYPVHYRTHMHTIHAELMRRFKGRVKVAGPWWQGGVGVNDCVMKAWETAVNIQQGWDRCTGLERYGHEERWYRVDKKDQSAVRDNPGSS